MAEENHEEFLDDIETLEAEEAIADSLEELARGEPEDEATAGVDAIIAERDEYKDRWMRALADAENSRKRSERDRKEAENYGGSKLSRDLLPVFDNMKRALLAAEEAAGDADKALLEGVELTMRELVNTFAKHGIVPIAPDVGDRFDPNLHQAMFEAPLPGTRQGDIIQVATEGFMLHDRLLRPAQVGVSSTPKS